MNFDFSFVPNYLPYYFEGVKYTLLISLITVFFGALFGIFIILYEDVKLSYLEDKAFKDNSGCLY